MKRTTNGNATKDKAAARTMQSTQIEVKPEVGTEGS